MMHTSDNFCESMASRGASSNGAGEPLPEGLRWAVEYLSGYDMGDVRVHYASDKPGGVGARAFAHGTAIHLAAGAEDALPHEVWHVVQQKQGRVRETSQLNGAALNDDPILEREADAMGAVASSLSWSTLWRNVRKSLNRKRIATPVLQRVVTVGADRYTSSKDDFEHFVARVGKLLQTRFGDNRYVYFPPKVMAEILSDFVLDDEQFANDEALLREIAIRNVGYRAESAMRLLMDKNAKVLGRKMVDKDKAIEAAKKQWALDEQAAYSDRHYKDYQAFKLAVDEIEEDALEGYIIWRAASYLTQTTSSPMAQWLAGRTNDEPLAMNCWECVLYSLVKSGLVGKGYISWANVTLNKAPYWKSKDEFSPIPSFLPEIIKIRDYFWSVSNGPLENADRRAQRMGWADDEIVCIPSNVKIPRGRVVILNFGAHVAISTGRAFRIESEKAQEFFGTTMGHGILELDKPEKELRTIKETTIEDLLNMGRTYLKHVLIAPFPAIAKGDSPVRNDEVRTASVPSVKEAIQAFLDQNSGKIATETQKETAQHENNVQKLQSQITALEQNPPIDQAKYNTLVEKIEKLKKSITSAENRVKEKWERAAMSSTGVQNAIGTLKPAKQQGFVKLPMTFAYEAVDPYYGLVTFPDKK
ncbi:MAG: DUF4157 domain-containing protein [Polyangiaceae bacterium]|nr:DUF4157 domain-containing protein [Polyangiaceae bacterium]